MLIKGRIASLIVIVLFITVNTCHSQNSASEISQKYRSWILGSASIDYSHALIQQRYKAIIKNAEEAERKYQRDKNKDGIPDVLLSAPFNVSNDKNKVSTLLSNYLFPLSLAYHLAPSEKYGLSNTYYQSEKVEQQLLEIFNNLHAHGWTAGVDIGVLHMDKYPQTGYIGYYSGLSLRCLGYALSVFLNKELLQEYGILDRELATLDFISKEVGPEYETPILWQQNGFNTDAVRSMFNVRWCYILSMKNSQDQQQELIYFSKLLNKSLQIADGWADMIKPDFMGYHHKGAYLTAYAPFGFHVASILVAHLDGTTYQVSQQAINNLSQAVLHTRIYCNKYDAPRSAAGRFPDKLGSSVKNLPAFMYLSHLTSPYQHELKGAFNRLWDEDFDGFKNDYLNNVKCGISYTGSMGEIEQSLMLAMSDVVAEEDPNGFWYYPYGGLGIYRQNDWLVSFNGCSKYIWDYESSKGGENQFGRFSRAGVLRIMAGGSPISAEGSGYHNSGWDWCKLPGATTVDMPFELMKQKKYKNSHRLFTTESYLGAVHIDGQHAVAAIKYNAPVSYDTPLKKLKADKSFFFFEDYIVAMGTNIQGLSDGNYPVQTTLFQNGLPKINSPSSLNGEKLTKAYHQEIKEKEVFLSDAQGHAYYIPKAAHLIVEHKIQSAPSDDGRRNGSGYFTNARLMHGSEPEKESYLYFIHVNGGSEGAEKLVSSHKYLFSIVQYNKHAHIVRYLKNKVTAYALFKAQVSLNDEIVEESNVACLAMIKNIDDENIELVVQNPELGKIDEVTSYNEINEKIGHASSSVQAVELTLKGQWQMNQKSDEVSIVKQDELHTVVRFNCFDGQRVISCLKKK
ncbi:chondroitinase family polysaccharide lyase [Carboxylicivirga sp. M1479]|uniref:chondroitinase family polysaccharide lyase n=1 Tax=Carboxylicivirga sp. M1479 TaxID=2594476 RepID=UPI00163D8E5B|nr:chondroitinase family polysaccharide lyase [Carboxylicivirga sp. M1479]